MFTIQTISCNPFGQIIRLVSSWCLDKKLLNIRVLSLPACQAARLQGDLVAWLTDFKPMTNTTCGEKTHTITLTPSVNDFEKGNW